MSKIYKQKPTNLLVKKREMNKKAQEGISLGAILLIVLGIIAVVVIVVGLTTGFGFITKIFGVAPGQTLEALAQSCKISAENDLRLDFCSFKELTIEGKKQFINCEDDRIKATLQIEPGLNLPDCVKDLGPEYDAKIFCETEKLDDSKIVNGKSCLDRGALLPTP